MDHETITKRKTTRHISFGRPVAEPPPSISKRSPGGTHLLSTTGPTHDPTIAVSGCQTVSAAPSRLHDVVGPATGIVTSSTLDESAPICFSHVIPLAGPSLFLKIICWQIIRHLSQLLTLDPVRRLFRTAVFSSIASPPTIVRSCFSPRRDRDPFQSFALEGLPWVRATTPYSPVRSSQSHY